MSLLRSCLGYLRYLLPMLVETFGCGGQREERYRPAPCIPGGVARSRRQAPHSRWLRVERAVQFYTVLLRLCLIYPIGIQITNSKTNPRSLVRLTVEAYEDRACRDADKLRLICRLAKAASARLFWASQICNTRVALLLGCGRDGTPPVVTLLDRQLWVRALGAGYRLDLFNFRFPCWH